MNMRASVVALQNVMREMPQVEMQTRHYYADGMYARELSQPVGSVVVGKVHKREHLFILLSGRIKVVVDEEVQEISAPFVLVSKPGTKRALFALEDSAYLTVHKTAKKNLAKIERELVENDETALFDCANKLKAIK